MTDFEDSERVIEDMGDDISLLKDEIERLTAERDALLAAADAVVRRWDTPLWKDAPATALFINDLRAAIDASRKA